MEFETSIDPSLLAEALNTRIEEDAAGRKHGFTVVSTDAQRATVAVHDAMHPQRSLYADLAWEATTAGSRVTVSYRAPAEGEVTPVGILAPLAAYLTMMLLVGGVMWGVGFGILFFMLGENRGIAWLLACIAPVIYLGGVLLTSLTARMRARRRFEKLMRDMFAE